MTRIVFFSGGIGSWAAAKRTVERHGTDDLILLFTDTLIEDDDLYRFLIEGAANIYGIAAATPAGALPPVSHDPEQVEARRAALAALAARAMEEIPGLRWIAEGRNPWQVFRDRRFLGNSRVDPCSEELKRFLADKWLKANGYTADNSIRVMGVDWSEEHRIERIRKRIDPWPVEAPMCDAPLMLKDRMLQWLEQEGIARPRLYRKGYAHNNCGGGCIKAEIGHFVHLKREDPPMFAHWKEGENLLREELGDVAILRDRSGGQVRPLPLAELEERIESGYQPDLFEIGGCGCMLE